MSPDDFICDLIDTYEEAGEKVLEEAVRAIKHRLNKPPLRWNQYFERLLNMEGNEPIKTVQQLRKIIPEEEIAADDQLFAAKATSY